jgi:class 3 adenylate cyclase
VEIVPGEGTVETVGPHDADPAPSRGSTATFLFTDIEGSTRLLERLKDAERAEWSIDSSAPTCL